MYFLKCILCDTPNVTYAMQKCMGKIEFMAKMSTPHLFFDNYSNTAWQFITFTIFTITTCIFSYSFIQSFILNLDI